VDSNEEVPSIKEREEDRILSLEDKRGRARFLEPRVAYVNPSSERARRREDKFNN
jgi:hypothetical protein